MTGNLPLLQAPLGPPRPRPLTWRRSRLLPAAALALAVLAGLLWYGLATWKALGWAAAFGAALPLTLSPWAGASVFCCFWPWGPCWPSSWWSR